MLVACPKQVPAAHGAVHRERQSAPGFDEPKAPRALAPPGARFHGNWVPRLPRPDAHKRHKSPWHSTYQKIEGMQRWT